ncbi:hypothetical protein FBALC1_16572 [Flavobacteriales bacterium ALC-1]|nr:hypothetical protein FBALC1_16572 [Flavobacteriales bacterium ALC-1]
MNLLISIIQNVDIDQKIKEAPDSGYSIGVFIGTILPFVILVAIAYAIYRYNKNRIKDK